MGELRKQEREANQDSMGSFSVWNGRGCQLDGLQEALTLAPVIGDMSKFELDTRWSRWRRIENIIDRWLYVLCRIYSNED